MVVAPQGEQQPSDSMPGWTTASNDVSGGYDEISFFDKMIEYCVSTYSVSENGVSMLGYSNGSAMTFLQ